METFFECTMVIAFCIALAERLYRLMFGKTEDKKRERFLLMTFGIGFLIGLINEIVTGSIPWMVVPYLLGCMLSYTAVLFTIPEKQGR